MRIKLLREAKEEVVRHIEGASGKPYTFHWNQKDGWYEYEAKSQSEVEDIFMSSNAYNWQFFAPILDNTQAALIPKPIIPRADYEQHELPELRALAKDCGLSVRASDDEATIKRFLDSFFLGAGVKRVAAAAAVQEEVIEDHQPKATKRERRAPAAVAAA